MLQRNYCMDILIENATTYSEKAKIYALTEQEQAVVNDRMVGNIYQSALKRRDIDFGDIPNSRGDIQKFGGYNNMVATINMLRELTKKFGIKMYELDIVENAVDNIRIQKRTFEKAYSLNIDFLKMYYQSLVLACIDATTLLLASYVEYTKTINAVEFNIKKGKGISGNICIDSLEKFNKSVKDGSFHKFADGLMSKKQENFLGAASAAAAGVKIAAAAGIGASIVPVLRTLIFYFYDAKMSVAEKLQYQKELLEMNAFRLNASSMDAKERNKILDKQKGYMDKLDKWADKIKISDKLATKSSTASIKQDNKQWNIGNVTNNGDDFMFI